jgi:hypothetical protein
MSEGQVSCAKQYVVAMQKATRPVRPTGMAAGA